jgi:hypothetical protein
MPEATSHSIRDLSFLFDALRTAAGDAVTALDAQPGGASPETFHEANQRALALAREIAAVQDADEK